MFKKRCKSCGEKIQKKFEFCPYCGTKSKNQEDYGMLGRDDLVPAQETRNEIKLPLGLNKIMGGLMKQLDRELNGMMGENVKSGGVPRGFQIRISSGMPNVQKVVSPKKKVERIIISPEEIERRQMLPKVEAKSTIKRLGDIIVYEISTPGIKNREQVIITKLEDGLEVKAYSKDKCYYKVIPLKIEVLQWGILGEKVVVELRG